MVFLIILLIALGFFLLVCLTHKRIVAPLKIHTFDGYDSPYHPSVVFVPNGWNGWKYWMVETPFSRFSKPYVDRNECPSIHVSNDGIHWTEPVGLTNPLFNLDDEQVANLDYYSDPHLVLKPDGVMECWFRYTRRFGNPNHRSDVALLVSSSSDGVSWSTPRIIKQLTGNDVFSGKAIVSPALIYGKDGYRMWCVDYESPTYDNRGIRLYTSKDGNDFEQKAICSFDRSINPWHIDVQYINDKLWMVIYDYNILTLWTSKDGISWIYVKDLIAPSGKIGSFYSDGLYRAALTQSAHGTVSMYFSSRDINKTYIGLMTGQTPDTLILDKKLSTQSMFDYVSRASSQILLKLGFVIKHLLKK